MFTCLGNVFTLSDDPKVPFSLLDVSPLSPESVFGSHLFCPASTLCLRPLSTVSSGFLSQFTSYLGYKYLNVVALLLLLLSDGIQEQIPPFSIHDFLFAFSMIQC